MDLNLASVQLRRDVDLYSFMYTAACSLKETEERIAYRSKLTPTCSVKIYVFI